MFRRAGLAWLSALAAAAFLDSCARPPACLPAANLAGLDTHRHGQVVNVSLLDAVIGAEA